MWKYHLTTCNEHIRRVSYGRRSPSDIGKDDIGDEHLGGVNVDGLTQLDYDGRHQKDGGHIVQDCRDERSQETEGGYQGPNAAAGQFEGEIADVIEDAGIGQNGY